MVVEVVSTGKVVKYYFWQWLKPSCAVLETMVTLTALLCVEANITLWKIYRLDFWGVLLDICIGNHIISSAIWKKGRQKIKPIKWDFDRALSFEVHSRLIRWNRSQTFTTPSLIQLWTWKGEWIDFKPSKHLLEKTRRTTISKNKLFYRNHPRLWKLGLYKN